uniref:AT-rich interactive domain-containing protein 4A-like n=1 Tax=Diabrotica virgifera virgifera TaxID=50390 RepID=A0A6P7GBL3_DIAVI
MDEANTPLNKTPTISNQDIDLHRLFRLVEKMGGYNRVTNQNKWRTVTLRLHLPGSQNIFNQVKAVYKKCLSSYETFYRTLGVTMLNHTRPTKKNKGRSLIRDRDRASIHSPAPEKEEPPEEKKEQPTTSKEPPPETPKPKRAEKRKAPVAVVAEVSDTNSSDTTEQIEAAKEVTRPKRERIESKTVPSKEKKGKAVPTDKVKTLVEKFEEQAKKEEEEKVQNTRSKAQSKQKDVVAAPVEEPKKEKEKEKEKKPEPKTPKVTKQPVVKQTNKPVAPPVPTEEEKKKGKKRVAEEKPAVVESVSNEPPAPSINIGDKLKVFYGSSNDSKVTYEAKVIEIDKDQAGQVVYLVHYTGWNTRYDEWIQPQRIAENLSATKKAKRSRQNANASPSSAKNQTPKALAKRTRVSSMSARSSTTEPPRSTTPSSVTSSGSRTKSPATPATRSTARLRQDSTKRTRRISAQTDVSAHTDSESEGTGSDSEAPRTRSNTKSENDSEIKTYRRRPPRILTTKPQVSRGFSDQNNHTEQEETKMQVDDPPYLSVGTAVSAKYKGAFCEAKVSKVVRLVKCKVSYKLGLGTATLTDEQIKGTLRVGQIVQAKHQDKKELVEATISKIQDCSQYTVVFDDGDITTLRRTALCLKSGRHFNESETLDQLPLTHPEHFGNPVVGGRRGRRTRQPK